MSYPQSFATDLFEWTVLFFLVEMHIKTWIVSKICTSFPSKTLSQQEVDLEWILTNQKPEN